MKLFFSVGEPSGDLHAANLIRELRARCPDVECIGYGGPKMAQAGARLHYPLTELAVMWILRVVLNIHRFLKLLSEADRLFARERPDGVVVVDYPGFNWWIARRAAARGIPVFYYLPPQLWAWGSWRIRKVRRFVDQVLSGLPFEVAWYRSRGVRAEYVGHPYFDEIAEQRLDPEFVASQSARPGRIVGLLPGSRHQEVQANFPVMLRVAAKVHARFPDVRFLVAGFRDEHRRRMEEMLAKARSAPATSRRHPGLAETEISAAVHTPQPPLGKGGSLCAAAVGKEGSLQGTEIGGGLPIEVCVGRTAEIIELSHACLAVSGSVGLELLYRTKPAVVLYQITRGAELVRRTVMTAPYISLVNLLAGERLLPEYVSYRDESEQLACDLGEWLADAAAHQRVVGRLGELRRRVVRAGATGHAAVHILRALGVRMAEPDGPVRRLPDPHFGPHRRAGRGFQKFLRKISAAS